MDSNQTAGRHQHHHKQQYDKIRVLGKGSFGTAVVHRRRADCSLVVLKEIDLQQFRGDKERSSALNEARIMSSLDHVNIIKYYNAFTTETKLLIEMEYASMGTLANYLSLQTNPLNEQEILVIFKQIVAGLSYLHDKQIVHLDLKTANIFVTVDGLVKIGDFGIAQYMQQQQPSTSSSTDFRRNSMAVAGGSTSELNGRRSLLQPQSGASQSQQQHFAGTLAYSSPERCMGDPTDFKSDIWSLGCILYELITSRPMFAGDNLAELVMRITRIQYAPIKRSNISPELRRAFEQTICLRPAQRPSASQLLETIERLSSIRQQAATTGQQHQQRQHTKLRKRQNYGLDLSTDAAAYMNNNNKRNAAAQDTGQLRYPHSLVYQVRLDSRHIQIDRVNLPLTKRIKEICKGKSHYLALTYDNIVFGWGSRAHGELGSCGLSCSSSARHRASWTGSGSRSSAVGSTKTFSPRQLELNVSGPKLECSPVSSPKAFIINELNHRKIIETAAGNDFSVFLSKTGIVMTCGDGLRGCLGRGNFKSSFTPCMVESLLNTDVVSIASGPEHVVAICGNGKAFAWGNSSRGRLGIGTRSLPSSRSDNSSTPSLISNSNEGGKFVSVPLPVKFASEEQVFVRGAFCGDRCTIFIDSVNRCWACGENRSNRLGLDVRRRFKKTLVVDRCWQPMEITALSKYQIVSCNIGKNHTTFITRDGKLLVYGQDIDQSYKLRSNIMNGIQSHRRISFELQTARRRSQPMNCPRRNNNSHHQSIGSIKKLTKSTVMNNQSSEFKQSKEDNSTMHATTTKDRKRYPRYSLTKLQRQQVDTYLKKTRATKKMPFECVIASSCTKKFTLALTNDNRVYFWGTRSYVRDDNDFVRAENSKSSANQIEPQLVPTSADECFVKIGATNRSLMNTIQTLGSDQPIVHGQDPRLTANTLADLWILDYELPSTSCSCSSSSASISSSSSSSFSESQTPIQDDSWSLAASSGCCSSCCSLPEGHRSSRLFSTHKHDAILDPQPIVSLYVPSMFNHSGCSLQLVDLFCFDEDKFYLVLDTTVKMHQLTTAHASSQQQQQQSSSSSRSQRENVRDERNQLKLRLNSPAAAAAASATTSGPAGTNNRDSNRQQTRRRSSGDESEEVDERPNKLDILAAIQESPKNTSVLASNHDLPQRSSCCAYLLAQASRWERQPSGEAENQHSTVEATTTSTTTTTTTDDNNNVVVVVESDTKCDLTPGTGDNQSILIAAASLDEPRSMSTFVANSLGQNQIIVGPSMRLAAAADQNMEPLRFSDSPEEKSLTVDESTGVGTTLAGECDQPAKMISGAIRMRQNSAQGNMTNRRKSRQLREKSESTTTSCTCNETSPMPSWVRNEFDMQQQQQHPLRVQQCDEDDYMFAVDSSSATEGTCITERPLFGRDDDVASIVEPEDPCQCTEQTPKDSSAASSIDNVPVNNDAINQANDDMGALANLAGSFLSRSQPDIRLGQESEGVERVSAMDKQDQMLQVEQSNPLTSRRSFATLDENIKLDASSIVGQNNLLDCDVYRNQNQPNGDQRSNNCLQASLMNMSGLSTRSSSNNPLIGSPSLVRKNASDLPLGGLNGRYTGTTSDNLQQHQTAGYLWPSNSNLHDGLQRSSSSINEMKLNYRQQQQQRQHQTQSLCKSVQQLNAEQVAVRGANSKRTNGSASSITSSLRKSLLKLFC